MNPLDIIILAVIAAAIVGALVAPVMETAAAAENAIENKRSKQTWIKKPCLFFCVCIREDVLNGKNCKNQKKAIDNFG